MLWTNVQSFSTTKGISVYMWNHLVTVIRFRSASGQQALICFVSWIGLPPSNPVPKMLESFCGFNLHVVCIAPNKTLHYISNGCIYCPEALNQGCYTCQHDSVLPCLVASLDIDGLMTHNGAAIYAKTLIPHCNCSDNPLCHHSI